MATAGRMIAGRPAEAGGRDLVGRPREPTELGEALAVPRSPYVAASSQERSALVSRARVAQAGLGAEPGAEEAA